LSDDDEEEASMTRNMRATIKYKMVTKRKQEMTMREAATRETTNTEDGDEGDQGDMDDQLQQEEREGVDKEEKRRQRSRI
jgi:hypothetical protein